MKIIITGISGYLGSQLANELLYEHDIMGTIRSSSSCWRVTDMEKVKYINIDEDDWIRKIKEYEPDIVINTVASYGRNNETFEMISNANINFPLSVLNSMNKGCFINCGTSLPSNINDYALTKNKFSLLAKKKCKENIKFIDLKLEHFFGPFDEPTKFTTYVIQGCKKDGNLKFTAGMQQRDFIYIIDLVNAFKCIISNLDKLRRNESISIGTGDVVTIRKFVETVANITEYKGILSFGEIPYRDNEVMLSYASLDRMKEFGWKCKFNLSDAIRDTLLREAC